LQEPGTSEVQIKGKEKVKKRGPSTAGPASAESKGPSQGPSKRQRSSGALLMAGRRRGSRKFGNRAMPELLRRASGWPWYAMVIRGFRSSERIL